MPGKRESQQSTAESYKKADAILHLRVYKPQITRVGGVLMKVYEPLEEAESLERIEVRTKKDIVDAIYNKVQKDKPRLISRYRDALVEVDVEGKGFALFLGESTEGEESLKPDLIFPRPARIIRVGVVKQGQVKWAKPKKGTQYYVFEGLVEVPKGADAVIVETDRGRRIITRPYTPTPPSPAEEGEEA